MRSISVTKEANKLVLTKSRGTHLISLVFQLAFFSLWYYTLLSDGSGPWTDRVASNPSLWLFLAAPLLPVRSLVSSAKVALFGEVLTFDRGNGFLLLNGSDLAPLGHIVAIRTRTIGGEAESFRTSIALANGTIRAIHESSNMEEIFNLADNLAYYLRLKVVHE